MDKNGDSVIYAPLPPASAAKGADIEQMKTGRMVQCEASQRVQRELHPDRAAQYTVVIDMSELSLSHVRPAVVRASKRIVEPDLHYPSVCKRTMLRRVPALASGLLKVALALIPKRILPSKPLINKSLLSVIDEDQIPGIFKGGTASLPVVYGGAVFPPRRHASPGKNVEQRADG